MHTAVSQMWIRGRLLNAAHSRQTTCYLLLTQASTDESGEFTPHHLLTFHTARTTEAPTFLSRTLGAEASLISPLGPSLHPAIHMYPRGEGKLVFYWTFDEPGSGEGVSVTFEGV